MIQGLTSQLVPISGIVFVLLWAFLKLETPHTPIWAGLKAIDWTGGLFVVGSTIMLLLALDFGGVTHPWDSATVICLIVFSVVAFGVFIVNESKLAKYPIIPLMLFRRRSGVASFLVCFCHGFIFLGQTYYLPLYFQGVLGASPIMCRRLSSTAHHLHRHRCSIGRSLHSTNRQIFTYCMGRNGPDYPWTGTFHKS